MAKAAFIGLDVMGYPMRGDRGPEIAFSCVGKDDDRRNVAAALEELSRSRDCSFLGSIAEFKESA
jgi:hypothetical protein